MNNKITLSTADELVGWEYRFYDKTNKPEKWTKWERCVARNPHVGTDKDFAEEIQSYINMGYNYELRALYTKSNNGMGNNPVGFIVYWGLGNMKPHYPPYKTLVEAQEFAATVKSDTKIFPLYLQSNSDKSTELLTKLVAALDKTHWVDKQSTMNFDVYLDNARDFLENL